MDYVECPVCGRAYTWFYLHSGTRSTPLLETEYTVVCDAGGHDFNFVVYVEKSFEKSKTRLVDTIEEYVDKKWWAPWRRAYPVVVTEEVVTTWVVPPTLAMVIEERGN